MTLLAFLSGFACGQLALLLVLFLLGSRIVERDPDLGERNAAALVELLDREDRP